jgi:serine phosphatase RsbU (regulator of sigma subunit)
LQKLRPLEYGRSRLSEVIKSNCNLTAQEVVDSIFSNLDRFNREPFDDQTLVVMKVK